MEELIKLCKHEDIEFESSFLFNRPYKYSGKEELRKLFWLTELRQFIHNKIGVYVNVDYKPYGVFTERFDGFYFSFIPSNEPLVSKVLYRTETQALQAGLEYFLTCYIDSGK